MLKVSQPDRADIIDLMQCCGCDERHAINLLQRSQNDLAKAKHRYQTMQKFRSSSSRGRSRSSVSQSTRSSTPPDVLRQRMNKPNKDIDKVILSASSNEYPAISRESSLNTEPSVSQTRSTSPHSACSDHTNSDASQTDEASDDSVSGEWDFTLPSLPLPSIAASGAIPVGMDSFKIRDLIGILQHRSDLATVRDYLGYYDQHTIRRRINDLVDGFPSLFYAVATNNESIVREWVTVLGADIHAAHKPSSTPLIAFAIVHAETLQADTTQMVATLLSLGADPSAIPDVFYQPYAQDFPEDGPVEEDLRSARYLRQSIDAPWLDTPIARCKLARNLNITHRYNLERAFKTPRSSARHQQVAHRRGAGPLLGLPYFLIGQSMPARWLLQKCISHLATGPTTTKRPLVMVFAGPSGHGKTELARRLGHLMSLDLEVVDCTIYNREMELFGPRHPYVNAEQGTPLNNFLARNAGKRCIVFLDEFEKTTTDIHKALLLPFDNGEYQDRRNLTTIDCSNTIWILATNALDGRIATFYEANEKALVSDDDDDDDNNNDSEDDTSIHERDQERMKLMESLTMDLTQDFLFKFGAPIAGRISAFLPFLYFSPGEQAVIVHKYLLELGRDVRRPVNMSTGADEQLVGNIRLRIRRDATVCRSIAERGYIRELGARSLRAAVENQVGKKLVDAYLCVDEPIHETDNLMDFVVDVSNGNIVARMV